jgi:uncharacterized secreted protein with C-terminal beta-propeller domain
MDKRRTATGIVTVGAVLAGLGIYQVTAGEGAPGGPTTAAADDHLQAYRSCDELLSHYRDAVKRTAGPYGFGSGSAGFGERLAIADSARSTDRSAGAPSAATASQAGAVGAGETGTNVQEKGVDEPDVAKVANGRLVTVTHDELQVLTAGPAPALLGSLPLDSYGSELLLDGDRALVVQHGYPGKGIAMPAPATDDVAPSEGATAPDAASSEEALDAGTTLLRLADLSDPAHPRWLDSWSVTGTYVSARLVDGTVRVVTTSAPLPDTVVTPSSDSKIQRMAATAANRQAAEALTLEQVLPQATHRDGTGRVLTSGAAVRCEDVSFAPVAQGADLTLVTTLVPAKGLTPVGSVGVNAPGDTLYAASDRMVVATTSLASDRETTQLHTFSTTGTATAYVASGSVPGHVLGRWALSWDEGVLRVATTEGPRWGRPVPVDGDVAVSSSGQSTESSVDSERTSASSVTTLTEQGKDLVVAGTVGGLGKGEQIKSVRYLGDLAVVVTFRQTDPLYVLDLADPTHPAMKGELKVTGFSTYLHPIGDGRLLGIGMEADAQTGRTTGLQATVFDLNDLSAPTLLSRLDLGEGWSPALEESRAFSYDPTTRLAVLPVQTYSSRTGASTFSGAVGITVGQDGRLTERGRLATGQDQPPLRALLSGETVLAVGQDRVVAGAAADLARTGAVSL